MVDDSSTDERLAPSIDRRGYLKTTGIASGLALTGLGTAASSPVAGATNQQLALDTEVTVEPAAYENFNNAPFDQQRITTYGNYQYVPYWNDDGRLSLCRRNLHDDSLQTIYFDYTLSSDDSHRTIVIGISDNDGRLHLSYDHHGDEMNWRYSDAGFVTSPPSTISANHFSDTTTMLHSRFDESSVTYPRFFNDDAGQLYCTYRMGASGNGDTYLHEHDARNNSWTRLGVTHSSDGTYEGWNDGSDSRNAYCHDWTFDDDGRLHVTWCWRETAATWRSNHDICYAYSDDYGTTWYNDDGTQIGDLDADDPIDVEDAGHVVVSVPTDYWLINQGTQVLDSNSNPHVFTFRSTVRTANEDERELHYVHYWRDADGTWHEDFVDDTTIRLEDKDITPTKDDAFSAPILNRDDVFVDADDDVHLYTAVDNRLYAAVATASSDWSDWTVYSLDTDRIVGTDGRKLDDRRWNDGGVLSIPLELPNSSGGRTFVVRDYTFESTSSPAKPDLRPTYTTTDGIELSWTEAERASSYSLHRRPEGGAFSEIASGLADPSFHTSYTDTNVQADTTYEYKIEANNDAGSTESDVITVTADQWGTVLTMDFEIVDDVAGPLFRIQDADNLYMWQVSVSSGELLRTHVKQNGDWTVLDEIDISNELGSSPNTIRIEADGPTITAWIDGTQVDQRDDTTFDSGDVGFRHSSVSGEHAIFDDVEETDTDGNVLFFDDFEGHDAVEHFDGGAITDDGRLEQDNTNIVQRIDDTYVA